jgi:hypothetical protein
VGSSLESIILGISVSAVIPALLSAIRVYLKGRKNDAKITIEIRNKNRQLIQIELNPENAEQAEEIIRKFLDQHPSEKPVAD